MGPCSLALGEAPYRGAVGGEVLRAIADGEQQGQVHGAGGEPGQPVQRFGVGPVDVVEDHHDRSAFQGEAGDQPVQAVAHALRIGGAAAAGDHQADRGGDDVVPAAENPAVLVLAGRREHRLEELAHHVEGRALFVFAATGPEHRAAAGGGLSAHLAQQRGLADAAGPLEGDHPAAAGLGPGAGIRPAQFGQRGVHRAQFPLPFQ